VISNSGPRFTRYRGKKKLNEAIYQEAPADEGADEIVEKAKSADYFNLNNAKQKAYRYLSLRAHSSKEIEKKLRQKGFPSAVIKEALEKLFELKYLDDALFAIQWARNQAVNRLAGNRKIIASLQEKGVAAELIQAAIATVRGEMPEEEAVALLIKKKRAKIKSGPQDIKEKKRIFQSLMGRGFPAGLIINQLGKIPEEDINGEDGQ
jgi:regulatory protein